MVLHQRADVQRLSQHGFGPDLNWHWSFTVGLVKPTDLNTEILSKSDQHSVCIFVFLVWALFHLCLNWAELTIFCTISMQFTSLACFSFSDNLLNLKRLDLMQHLSVGLVKENESYLLYSELLPNKGHTLTPQSAAKEQKQAHQPANHTDPTELQTEARIILKTKSLLFLCILGHLLSSNNYFK